MKRWTIEPGGFLVISCNNSVRSSLLKNNYNISPFPLQGGKGQGCRRYAAQVKRETVKVCRVRSTHQNHWCMECTLPCYKTVGWALPTMSGEARPTKICARSAHKTAFHFPLCAADNTPHSGLLRRRLTCAACYVVANSAPGGFRWVALHSHLTRLPKYASQVIGYRYAQPILRGFGLVIR